MAQVERALGFYIRYWEQMQALYQDESEDSRELLPSGAGEMVTRVGMQASEQAASLLKDCVRKAEAYLITSCDCEAKIRTTDKRAMRDWFAELTLWPMRTRNRDQIRWTVGYGIDRFRSAPSINQSGSMPSLVLYIWVRGGVSAEEKASLIFDGRVVGRSCDLGWNSGCIFLHEPFKIDVSEDFQIKRDSLVSWADETVRQAISKEDIQRLFEL